MNQSFFLTRHFKGKPKEKSCPFNFPAFPSPETPIFGMEGGTGIFLVLCQLAETPPGLYIKIHTEETSPVIPSHSEKSIPALTLCLSFFSVFSSWDTSKPNLPPNPMQGGFPAFIWTKHFHVFPWKKPPYVV